MDNAPHEDEPRGDEMHTRERDQRRTCCIALVICTALMIIAVIALLPAFLGARRTAWQSRAQGTLRDMGKAQLAYRDDVFDPLKSDSPLSDMGFRR